MQEYICKCGVSNCKLWRKLFCGELFCITCVGNELQKDFSGRDWHYGDEHPGLGSVNSWYLGELFIPAVPITSTEINHREVGEDDCWCFGEDHSPEARADWIDWYRLPIRPMRSIAALWISGKV